MHETDKEYIEPTRANVQLGFTRNMGNFESLRVEVGLEVSAQKDEKASALVDRVYDLVEKKLMERFQETDEALAQKGLGTES